MHHGVPVVAYGAAAVPETVGDAGIVLESKAPTVLATAVRRAVVDHDVRTALVAAGQRRLRDFDLDATRRRLVEVLAAHGVTDRP
jgi:L-malate glycosyltransferase